MASQNKGISLVEVMIAAAIILLAVTTLLSVHSLYIKVAFSNANAIKAAYLAEEGIEAMRYLRDASWDTNIATLSLGTNYGLVLSGGTWQTSTTNTYVDNFQRTLSFAAVNRGANGDIVSSGGAVDPGTLLLTSSVSWWNGTATTTKSIATYLTDLYGN